MKKLTEKELEVLIHSTLRSLPNRKAPGTLEARVLAAVEHRAVVAWYHRSWNYWPAAIRASFLAVATAVTGAVIIAFYLVLQGVDAGAVASEVGSRFAWLSRFYSVGVWSVDFVNHLFGSIPPLWIYGGLATLAAIYAAFLGIGAAAYRAFSSNN